jgi:hypothetical protein
MKLNLGCGRDLRQGYLNVDFVQPCDRMVDLSKFPWPWGDGEADEILMLDFLEHFPYRDTSKILMECWRVLKKDGLLEVQVPDFAHCARAAMALPPFMCNRCPTLFDENLRGVCHNCGAKVNEIAEAAVRRLYGGQDVPGNWHYNAFTQASLELKLMDAGFDRIDVVEKNQNGETYFQNWNLKLQARKSELKWEE